MPPRPDRDWSRPAPQTHTVAALDQTGASQAVLTVPNTPEGLEQLHALAQALEARVWAVEGASNRFIAAFVARLLALDERVVQIPLGLTSQYRARRGRKKNDLVDAENAARVLRANPELGYTSFPCAQRTRSRMKRLHSIPGVGIEIGFIPWCTKPEYQLDPKPHEHPRPSPRAEQPRSTLPRLR